MLSYKTLTAGLMESWGLDKKVKSDFPLPIIRFLQFLLHMDLSKSENGNDPRREIAERIEREILGGKIEQKKNPVIADFHYVPDLLKHALSFHMTSSMVSELAPLVIFLKGNANIYPIDSIIFEEPESHLHINAQRLLAKYLVKLVNNGIPVWMTTHSDVFFQQINNLIAATPEHREKLLGMGYKEDEILRPDDIGAYQFNTDESDGMTRTIPLEQDEDGFIVPTFNESVRSLVKETIDLEEEPKEDAE